MTRISIKRRRRRPGERGVALLIVLWILALLALVAASFTLTSHTDITLARNEVDSTAARELADSAIARAVVGLSDSDPKARWVADGRSYRWRFGGGEVVISITDEGGKISLNAAPRDAIESAFHYARAGDALAGDLTDAVMDRRQSVSTVTSNSQAFLVGEDLQTLPGMTAPVYYRAAPLFTVYGQSPGVAAMLASRDVLLALPDADASEIDAFIAARNAAAADPTALPPAPPLSVAPYLSGGATGIVTIDAHATTATGAVFVREATITLQADPTRPFITQTWKQLVTLQ